MSRASILEVGFAAALAALSILLLSCSNTEPSRPASTPEDRDSSQSERAPTAGEAEAASQDDPSPPPADGNADTVILDLRLWQNEAEPTSLSIQARFVGYEHEFLARHSLTLSPFRGYAPQAKHPFAIVAFAGVELRVHQRLVDPERIFVKACASECPDRYEGAWRPLGMNPVLFDDGVSDGGAYRFGDLRIAIPRGSPGLLKDREHLLALRDVFAADPPLDWSA